MTDLNQDGHYYDHFSEYGRCECGCPEVCLDDDGNCVCPECTGCEDEHPDRTKQTSAVKASQESPGDTVGSQIETALSNSPP